MIAGWVELGLVRYLPRAESVGFVASSLFVPLPWPARAPGEAAQLVPSYVTEADIAAVKKLNCPHEYSFAYFTTHRKAGAAARYLLEQQSHEQGQEHRREIIAIRIMVDGRGKNKWHKLDERQNPFLLQVRTHAAVWHARAQDAALSAAAHLASTGRLRDAKKTQRMVSGAISSTLHRSV